MSGVFPNVRGAVSVVVESQDVVTAAAVALGVLELEAKTSADIVRRLLKVLQTSRFVLCFCLFLALAS